MRSLQIVPKIIIIGIVAYMFYEIIAPDLPFLQRRIATKWGVGGYDGADYSKINIATGILLLSLYGLFFGFKKQ